jgi:hypothetical protein
MIKCGMRTRAGSELTHLDCRIAPILQHIRIALLHLKHYTLPAQLPHLWNYMRNIYANDVFAQVRRTHIHTYECADMPGRSGDRLVLGEPAGHCQDYRRTTDGTTTTTTNHYAHCALKTLRVIL